MDRSRTLGPNGVVIQNWSDTDIKVHNVNYVWVIHEYLFHKEKLKKGEGLKSPIFFTDSDEGSKWYLDFFPNGKDGDRNDASLFVLFDTTSDHTYVYGRFKFSLLDENMKEFVSFPILEVKKFERGKGFGVLNFIGSYHQSSLKNTVTIYCEVKFSSVDLTTTFDRYKSITVEPNVPERRLIEDLKQLFKNEESKDVVLTVNGKDYKAHKSILIARSPVFASMFSHEDMLENQQNKVNITDFSERVIEEMLTYIYTGMPENLEELASDLMAVAEKYCLDGLKDLCENSLIKNLSVDNAVDTLEFADLLRATKLKSCTLNFIVAKYTEVMKTAAWKKIKQSVLLEVCDALASSKK